MDRNQASKILSMRERPGKVNEHNSCVPRDNRLDECEKEAILDYYQSHCQDGYRRLIFIMLDEDIVAVSSSGVYRELAKMRKEAV
ncbi:MAG: hypothetical protein K8F52_01650 [Candidatus Scalindua rubra]|nr:hypothetical protein [Candidatus Scalindua rubra]